MNLHDYETLTDQERETFRTVCNQLLSSTFVVRTVYRQGKGRVSNPNYTFLATHFELVRDYLSLLDWELHWEDYNGYYFVLNTDEANRCNLNKAATAILLALRMIYDENQERVGLEHDAICTVRDVLEKVVTDYAILPARPNMDEVKRALTLLENHHVIERMEGRFNQNSCKFAVLPTILTAVSSDRLSEIVSAMRKEEEHEETEEDSSGELALLSEAAH